MELKQHREADLRTEARSPLQHRARGPAATPRASTAAQTSQLGGRCPGVLRCTRASSCPLDRLTTRSFSSAAAAGTSQGAQPPHPPPPPRLPAPPPLPPLTPRTRRRSTPRSAPPQLQGFCKAPEAGRQQPLAAQRLGIRAPARSPAALRLSGRLWGAMIYYTAVPASGASRAQAVAAGGPDPHPRPLPEKPPQTQTPAPGSSPPRTEPGDATHTP